MNKLILLIERIRFNLLSFVRYYGIIDSYLPMIPAVIDWIS